MWDRLAAERRVGIVEQKHDNPKLKNSILGEHQLFQRDYCWWLFCCRFGFQHASRVCRDRRTSGHTWNFWNFLALLSYFVTRRTCAGTNKMRAFWGFETVNFSNRIVSC